MSNKIPVPNWQKRVDLDISVGLLGGVKNLIPNNKIILERIISGGQTGADRASLEAAKELGILTGGYAPKGYKTENGQDLSLKELFGLIETDSYAYNFRTIMNISRSDGTVIFGLLDSPGSKFTIKMVNKLKKPLLTNPRSPEEFINWILQNNIKTLNCAGNRESVRPGIHNRVKTFLINTLKDK